MATRSSSRKTGSKNTTYNKRKTRELFRRYKQEGDLEARNQIIENHLNLVRFLANKFKNRGESIEDLIQVGNLALIKAVDRYDPELGHEFTTYATPTIIGEIKRYFRDKGWSVRVPRRLQELSAKINHVTEDLVLELQRNPSVEEIALKLGVTPEEVLEAMESSAAYNAVSLESSPDDEEGGGLAQIDKVPSYDKDLMLADDRLDLQNGLKDFSDREREIIKLRFVDDLTQIEIAEKLGISQVQVSRLLRKMMQKLQQKIEPSYDK